MEKWHQLFKQDPDLAVAEGWYDRADMGLLSYNGFSHNMYCWLENATKEEHDQFDRSTAIWIVNNWAAPLERPTAEQWRAARWHELCQLVGNRKLLVSLNTLKDKRALDSAFLASMSFANSRDPEKEFWIAVANNQTDDTFIPMWKQFARLENVPYYYGDISLRGLCRLPEITQELFNEILNTYAKSIRQLAKDGKIPWLGARETFLLDVRMLGYAMARKDPNTRSEHIAIWKAQSKLPKGWKNV